jgi:hypothetical protein
MIYRRIRALGTRAVQAVTDVRAPRGRARVVVAATAATALAVGAGITWGLAGGADERSSGAADAGPRVAAPGGPTAAGLDAAGLDPAEPPDGDGATGGGGPPGGGGSGLGSGIGGEPAANRPPVIEDPGLSSDGMTLTVAPTVTDPDGDPVEVGYDDGNGFVLVSEQPTLTYPVRDSPDGYGYPVELTIHATDAHGAVTRNTFTHHLEAISTVVVRRVELRLESPQSCFANSAAERFTADLVLGGAVVLDRRISAELRPDRPTAALLTAPMEGEVTGRRPRQDLLVANATLAGAVGEVNLQDLESPVRPRRMFLDSRCRATVRVGIQITTR